MSSLFRFLLSAGPAVLGLALVMLPLIYLSRRRESGRRVSLPFFLCASLGTGVLMYGVGTAAGIGLACHAANAGNLCGLVGFFGLGPLLAGLGIAGTAGWLVFGARRDS